MTGAFAHGGVVFPLDEASLLSLFELSDPALKTMLAYLVAVLEIQLGAALRTHASAEGVQIASAVLTSVEIEPLPAIYVDRTRFPFFALYRKSETFAGHTTVWDKSVGEWEFAYVLPALMLDTQRRIVPVLHAVARVIGRAVRAGRHPEYQNNRKVLEEAGIMSARLVAVRYERYEHLNAQNQFFRAVVGTLEVVERDQPLGGGEAPTFSGSIDVVPTAPEPDAELSIAPPPMVTLVTPSSGTKLGGQSVTVTGTNFSPGALPRVSFGGIAATDVVRLSATQLSCVTPAHDAYPTFMADVMVETDHGQSVLRAGYTFVTP